MTQPSETLRDVIKETVAERVGIKLDTPTLHAFWEAMEPWADELTVLTDAIVDETIEMIGDTANE